MKYKLAKKGYLVGDIDAIERRKFYGFNYPNDWIDVVHTDSSGKAKAIFSNIRSKDEFKKSQTIF